MSIRDDGHRRPHQATHQEPSQALTPEQKAYAELQAWHSFVKHGAYPIEAYRAAWRVLVTFPRRRRYLPAM